MGQNDHAIVVGINHYPSLDSNLDGPENDALDFSAWLKSARGGNVPAANVHVVLSRDFQPQDPLPQRARPSVAEITSLLDDWYALGDANGTVGDRLYIYLAGHGFSKDIESAALLMANAKLGAITGRHLPGRPYANFFRQAAFAKEVVLFMDCCRQPLQSATIVPAPYDPRSSAVPGQKFFGFATKWGRNARESQTAAGAVRGAFSLALLSGLRGGAAADANGQIRGADLESYVFGVLRGQANALEEPEFEYNKMADILFNPPPGEAPCNPLPPLGPVAAAVAPPASPGYLVRANAANDADALELIDGGLAPVPLLTQEGAQWCWHVPTRGIYSVKLGDGSSRFVEVVGDQKVIDVQL